MTKKTYEHDLWPEELCGDMFCGRRSYDDPYYEVDDGTWHIGQCWGGATVNSLQCKKCGGKEFHVGGGDLYTAVRCVACRWEVSVHNG